MKLEQAKNVPISQIYQLNVIVSYKHDVAQSLQKRLFESSFALTGIGRVASSEKATVKTNLTRREGKSRFSA